MYKQAVLVKTEEGWEILDGDTPDETIHVKDIEVNDGEGFNSLDNILEELNEAP